MGALAGSAEPKPDPIVFAVRPGKAAGGVNVQARSSQT
jgi:hypothetical protein